MLVLLTKCFRGDRNVMGSRLDLVAADAHRRAILQAIVLGVRIEVDVIVLDALGERSAATPAGL